jgi:outer membrane immunogenic protein
VVAAYNWTGFYIGAMGGYGWSQSVSVAGLVGATNDIKGGFGGGTVGFNYQSPGSPLVVGIEVDGAWSGIQYNETLFGVTFQERINAFGSATGRVGVAVDAALFYAKGGFAFAENKMSLAGAGILFSQSRFHPGWTVGGGLEYGLTPNWSAKAEYMYADYSAQNYGTVGAIGIGFGASIHTVKAGINYRFGWDGPVTARY